jgi:hypothetical protein
VFDRPYDERQRYPADVEACEGMGRITEHDLENLVPSDKGLVMARRRLAAMARDLEAGKEPQHASDIWPGPVPTYGGDTVLHAPVGNGDDRKLLREVAAAVMEVQFEAENLTGTERDDQVIERLKRLEADGLPL